MAIKLTDYVKDAKVKDGAVFNGLKVRVVGEDVLFDFAGMNPAAAKQIDPENEMGIKPDEILLNKDTDSVNKDTVNHECSEYEAMKGDPKLGYWKVHTALQALAEKQGEPEDTNLSIKPPEVKSMATGTKITKTYRAEIKQIDENNHRVYAVFNTSGRDRDNEANAPTAWKKRIQPFLEHNILVSCHTYDDLRKQIGEIELNMQSIDNGLEGWVTYYVGEGNDEADWGFNLAKKNKAAYSVGYMSFDGEKGDGEKAPRFLFTDNELLEVSQVIVPSNRQSLSTSTRSVSDPVVKSLLDEVETMVVKNIKKEYSQDEIRDEIDYLTKMTEVSKLSPENQELIKRITGPDTPDDITTKATKTRIKHAMDACKSAMDIMQAHDKAHAAAFETHSKAIIRCYTGLKSMYANETTPDGSEGEQMVGEVNPAEPAMSEVTTQAIDEIVANVVSKI